MSNAEAAAGAFPVIAPSLRRPLSLVASLLLHALLAMLLVGSGAVRLTLQPAPMELLLLEAAARTAGPGELASELRIAAPPPAVTEAERIEPAPVESPKPQPAVDPVPSPKSKAVARKTERPKLQTPPVAPAPPAAEVPSVGAGGDGATGDAARATAPAWAPTARVRYEELLFAWMNRHKEYPVLAQRRGLEGRGSLRVRIDRDGRVLERALLRSTGQSLLDDAALDMVRRASPFPAVPDGYAGSTFEFVAPIEYRLR